MRHVTILSARGVERTVLLDDYAGLMLDLPTSPVLQVHITEPSHPPPSPPHLRVVTAARNLRDQLAEALIPWAQWQELLDALDALDNPDA